MNKLKNILLSGLIAGICVNANANTDEEGMLEMSGKFAQCAALQDTMARAVTQSDAEFRTHFLHEAALGGQIVSKFFAQMAGYKDAYAQSRYDGYESQFRSMLNLAGLETFLVDQKPLLNECVGLSKLQGQIITEMRKQAYKN